MTQFDTAAALEIAKSASNAQGNIQPHHDVILTQQELVKVCNEAAARTLEKVAKDCLTWNGNTHMSVLYEMAAEYRRATE